MASPDLKRQRRLQKLKAPVKKIMVHPRCPMQKIMAAQPHQIAATVFLKWQLWVAWLSISCLRLSLAQASHQQSITLIKLTARSQRRPSSEIGFEAQLSLRGPRDPAQVLSRPGLGPSGGPGRVAAQAHPVWLQTIFCFRGCSSHFFQTTTCKGTRRKCIICILLQCSSRRVEPQLLSVPH